MPSEKELIATGNYVRCRCNNLILISEAHCKYCHSFNHATSAKECPTCGNELKLIQKFDAIKIELKNLKKKHKALVKKTAGD